MRSINKEFYNDFRKGNESGDKVFVTGIVYTIFCDCFMGIIIAKINTFDGGGSGKGMSRRIISGLYPNSGIQWFYTISLFLFLLL
jgi:hypothetical protein